MDKNILFYSDYCDHSKELLRSLKKNPINSSLIFVCVDDKSIQVPNFIKVVPTIYLVNNKSVLTDNEIMNWVNQTTKPDSVEINAYNGDNTSALSTSFSFLDDGDNSVFSNQYTFLNQSDTINTPKESTNSVNDELSKSLERLQNSRNNESYSSGIQRM